VKTQAELAFENGMAFYNMFASMGGAGTIVKWADSTPTLAGHDYVHPNGRGAELLGNIFFESFMKDYEKANNPNAPQSIPQPQVKPAVAEQKKTATEKTPEPPKEKTLPAKKKDTLPIKKTQEHETIITTALPVKDTSEDK
jgi:hypothetical protein